MQINTDRLRLRNFKIEYAEAFTKALKDPRIFEYLPERVPDLDDIKKLIQWFVERDRKNSRNTFVGTNLAISMKATQKIIGWCGLQPFEPLPDKKEIFFGLSPDYWNNGYMTEAARAVVAYGFRELGLKEIVAGVKPENIASIRVIEKLGFTFQQILTDVPKESAFYRGMHFYALANNHT